MKACIHCGVSKSLDQFYTHPNMADGHLNACKVCHSARVKGNRRKNVEAYRAYERERRATPRRQAHASAYQKDWLARFPEKRRAQNKVRRAIQRGALVRQPCEVCGSTRVHAHHDDYSQPLKVRWLCAAHHNALHHAAA